MKKLMMGLIALFLAFFFVAQAIPGTWTSNNFIYKPSLGARGTTEKNSYDAGLDRVDARLSKEIWVGDPNYGATVQSVVTAIAAANVTLRIPAGTWNITDNLIIPANVHLKVERGAVFAVATTKTLTINGGLEAGLYQIFSCAGTGKVVFGPGAVKEVYPEWWTENITPGTTDMTAALLAAIAAVPTYGTVSLQPISYKVTQTLVPSKSLCIIAKGNASQNNNGGFVGTTLSWDGDASPVISIGRLSGVNLYDLVIQCNGKATYGIDVGRLTESDWRNIKVDDPTIACIRMLPTTTTPSDNTNFNNFTNLTMRGPIGLILDAADWTIADCCLNTFTNLRIAFTGAAGIQLFGADSNNFIRTFIYRNSGNGVGLHIGDKAYDNCFWYLLATGGTQVDAPVSGRSPFWTNTIVGYDVGNTGSLPTIADGAFLNYTTTTDDASNTPPRWNLPTISSIYSSSTPGISVQNKDSANPAKITLYNANRSRSGSILMWPTISGREFELMTDGAAISLTPGGVQVLGAVNDGVHPPAVVTKAPAAAPDDSSLFNGSLCFYQDESLGLLKAKIKTSSGTVSTLPLAPATGCTGTATNSSGPITVTTASNGVTNVATAAVTYNLPTGNLGAFCASGVPPLRYKFVKTAAGAVTIDPGTGNYIGPGAAGKTVYDDVAGETYAHVTVQLVSSVSSVNKWIVEGHGTWTAAP